MRASADLATLGSEGFRGGVVHWADAATATPATFRLYDRLFTVPVPEEAEDVVDVLNPESLVETQGFTEPGLEPGVRYQFERLGFFVQDTADSAPGRPVYNRIVALRDSWGKKESGTRKTGAEKAPLAPPPVVGPRDPAAGLSEAERSGFEALVARGVGPEEAAVLAADAGLAELFEGIVGVGADVRDAANLLVQDVRPLVSDGVSRATPGALAEALALRENGTLTKASQRTLVAHLVAEGGDAQAAVERLGLAAVRDDAALVPAVEAALAEHPDKVAAIRGGEARLVGFLVGQAMRRAPKGADPTRVQELLRERLEA